MPTSYMDGGPFHSITALMDGLDRKLASPGHSLGEMSGLPTGFTRFDEMTNGLHRGELIVVAGRPSMGKTIFAMNVAEHVTLEQQQPAAFFSMESSAELLALRLLSSFGRIRMQSLLSGEMDDMEAAKFAAAGGMIRNAPLFIDDSREQTPSTLRTRARQVAGRHGLRLIVVDCIQLMQSPRLDPRSGEISCISRSLKELAQELDVPVLALSQVSRDVEYREDRRPGLADLRGSDRIEEYADLVAFLYRDAVYKCEQRHGDVAEIILAKQRRGPLGTCRTVFLSDYTRFDNLECLSPAEYEHS